MSFIGSLCGSDCVRLFFVYFFAVLRNVVRTECRDASTGTALFCCYFCIFAEILYIKYLASHIPIELHFRFEVYCLRPIV